MAVVRESSAWRMAWQVVVAQRGKLGLGLVLLLGERAAGFVLPLAPKVLIDDVVIGKDAGKLTWVTIAVLGAAVVQAGLVFALARVLGVSGERVVLDWRRRAMARVTRLPIAEIDRHPTGALLSRVMDDPAAVANLVGWEVTRWVSRVLTAAVALVALLWIDWKITLAALGFAAVPALGIDRAYKKLGPVYRERSVARAAVAGRLGQTLAGLRVVKAYGAERREVSTFARGLHVLFRLTTRATTRRAAMSAFATVITAGVVCVVLVLGGRAMLEGRLSIGTFGSYVAFALMFSAPLVDLPEVLARFGETLADLERVRELAAVPPERGGNAESPPGAEVVFDDVHFGYGPDKKVLRGVSFVAAPGTTTAIVGPSGAGKSTIAALVLALYRPDHGTVLVGGHDLASIRLASHRRRLAVVLQDDFLFDGTIAENVAFGRPSASREEILRACEVAQCTTFLRALPDGLDTVVGERGVRLSGGQRQRVSIARALVSEAPLLVLDEATSSLDTETEAAVQAALALLHGVRTVLVIAHRLSTVRTADQILVLEDGAVVERGDHAALLARSGRYRALYER